MFRGKNINFPSWLDSKSVVFYEMSRIILPNSVNKFNFAIDVLEFRRDELTLFPACAIGHEQHTGRQNSSDGHILPDFNIPWRGNLTNTLITRSQSFARFNDVNLCRRR